MMQTNVVSCERRQKMMLEEPMLCVIPKVAIPMIISTVIDSLYNLADTFLSVVWDRRLQLPLRSMIR